MERIVVFNGKEIFVNPNGDCFHFHAKWKRRVKLIPTNNGKGYFRLSVNGKTIYIHRLVAMAFIDNPNNKPHVNHMNGIKSDNRVDNLEWATESENSFHAINTGLHKTRGEDSHFAKLTSDQVLEILKDTRPAKEIASSYGITYKKIYDIRNGYAWSHLTGIKYNPKKRIKIT